MVGALKWRLQKHGVSLTISARRPVWFIRAAATKVVAAMIEAQLFNTTLGALPNLSRTIERHVEHSVDSRVVDDRTV